MKENFNIGKISWFGVGGPAEFLFKPKSEGDLKAFLVENTKQITILGNTSNVIIGDLGIKGVTIRLGTSFMKIKRLNECEVQVGAAMPDKNFAFEMAELGLSGFEFLSTIPGNIGGGVKMNCGCFGREMKDVLVSIKGLDFKGNEVMLQASELKFGYRTANLPEDLIIISAVLRGQTGKKKDVLAKMEENQQKRNNSQPTGGKTCGSTFKNPEGHKAWDLLEKAGLRGVKIGGVSFSELHLNFMMNDGTGTAKDAIELGTLAQKLVYEKFGVRLEWEVKHIGEF